MKEFWDKITQRNKTRILWVGCALFLLIIYSNNISKTVTLYFENADMEAKIANTGDAASRISKLRDKNEKLDQSILRYVNNEPDNHEYLLQEVSTACKKYQLLLHEFPARKSEESFEYLINTSSATVQGSFSSIVKLIYEIEKEKRIAKISSCEFYTMQDPKTKRELLYCKLYLQNLSSNDNAKN